MFAGQFFSKLKHIPSDCKTKAFLCGEILSIEHSVNTAESSEAMDSLVASAPEIVFFISDKKISREMERGEESGGSHTEISKLSHVVGI